VASKDHILAAVAEQFQAIQKQLDLQLIRTGEIQAELDLQRQDTHELREQVKQVHALLNQYLKAVPLQAATPDRKFDRE
jgi:hypothetical protein